MDGRTGEEEREEAGVVVSPGFISGGAHLLLSLSRVSSFFYICFSSPSSNLTKTTLSIIFQHGIINCAGSKPVVCENTMYYVPARVLLFRGTTNRISTQNIRQQRRRRKSRNSQPRVQQKQTTHKEVWESSDWVLKERAINHHYCMV